MTDNGDNTYTYSFTAEMPEDITINIAKYTQDSVYIEYYGNQYYEGPVMHNQSYPFIDIDWTTNNVYPRRKNDLSAKFHFLLKPPTTDIYTFQFDWDDTWELYLDEEFIFKTSNRNSSETVPKDLKEDKYYKGMVKYTEDAHQARAVLQWSYSSQAMEVIPQTYYF